MLRRVGGEPAGWLVALSWGGVWYAMGKDFEERRLEHGCCKRAAICDTRLRPTSSPAQTKSG